MLGSPQSSNTNPEEAHLLFTFYALNEYQKKFGQEELDKFLERCPSISERKTEYEALEREDRGKKKEQEKQDTNQLLFSVWLISVEQSYLDRILRELLWKVHFSEWLQEEFDREFSQARFEKQIRELIEQAAQGDSLKLRLIESYRRFALNLMHSLVRERDGLISLRDQLSIIIERQGKVIHFLREKILTTILQQCQQLPAMSDPQLEALRRETLAEAATLLKDPKQPFEEFYKRFLTHEEQFHRYLHDPDNSYPSEAILKFDSAKQAIEADGKVFSKVGNDKEQVEKAWASIDETIHQYSKEVNKIETQKEWTPSMQEIKELVSRGNDGQLQWRDIEISSQSATEQIQHDTDFYQAALRENPDLQREVDAIRNDYLAIQAGIYRDIAKMSAESQEREAAQNLFRF